MSFGRLTPAQEAQLRPYVEGREVTDLGAGDLELALTLLQNGAHGVVAVDSALPRKSPDSRITLVPRYFHQYQETPGVGFVSWPCNWDDASLLRILKQTRTIIYLGKNTDGTICGGPQFWELLMTREVLLYSPDPDNTLIVYGDKVVQRQPNGEEMAGTRLERIWDYEETVGG